jgi:hypothetical protein
MIHSTDFFERDKERERERERKRAEQEARDQREWEELLRQTDENRRIERERVAEANRQRAELLAKRDMMPFSDNVAERICKRISGGELLIDICSDSDMPTARRAIEWTKQHQDFLLSYRAARVDRLDIFEEEIVKIADDNKEDWDINEKKHKRVLINDAIARSKLKIDVRLRHLRAGRPNIWGETSTLITKSGDPDDSALLSDAELRAKIEELDRKQLFCEEHTAAPPMKSKDLFGP